MTDESAESRSAPPRAVGVVLAGGQGRRLGGRDKALIEIAGEPLVRHVVRRLCHQVDAVVVSANGDLNRFRSWGWPVITDTELDADGATIGPLAGVLAGLTWAAERSPEPDCVVTVPVDGPLLPDDLVRRLVSAALEQDVLVACAASRGQVHPVSAVWSLACLDRLRNMVVQAGARSADRVSRDLGRAVVDWQAEVADPFLNINEPGDVDAAERVLRANS